MKFFFVFFFLSLPIFAAEIPEVTVVLSNPLYREGILSTEMGGIVNGPNIWLQAKKIVYTRSDCDHTLFAEGEILVNFRGQFLRAETLFFNFNEGCGSATAVRTHYFPLSLIGEEVLLTQDGTLVFYNVGLSPESSPQKNLELSAQKICLLPCEKIELKGVGLRLGKLSWPILPRLSWNLEREARFPLTLRGGWHGFRGSYLGIRYHFLSYKDLDAFLRLDGYLGHGPGIGLETIYEPDDSPAFFSTKNYYAHDLAIADPKERPRYRFQGIYTDKFFDETTYVDFKYDKVSDAEMASDYINDDFELMTAQKTELLIHRESDYWVANLIARAKVNSFQTVNQELPSLEYNLLPIEMDSTGIVFENYMRAGYQNFSFSDEIRKSKNFDSGRFEVRPKIYRHFDLGPLSITPFASWVGIYYTSSPERGAVGQSVGDFSLSVSTSLYRPSSFLCHAMEPYLDFHYLTPPRVPLDEHYIFTLDDAYHKFIFTRFGTRHFLTSKGFMPIHIDLYANAFYQRNAFKIAIPKVYLEADLDPTHFMGIILRSAWNIEERTLDFLDMQLAWTISEDFAIKTTYRHRSRFDFRKADFYNYLLEVSRKRRALLDSPLSDRRDLLLLHFFYRFSPNLNIDFELRTGWNRRFEPSFFEYQFALETPIFENLRASFLYEKKETDNRYLFSLNFAPGPP